MKILGFLSLGWLLLAVIPAAAGPCTTDIGNLQTVFDRTTGRCGRQGSGGNGDDRRQAASSADAEVGVAGGDQARRSAPRRREGVRRGDAARPRRRRRKRRDRVQGRARPSRGDPQALSAAVLDGRGSGAEASRWVALACATAMPNRTSASAWWASASGIGATNSSVKTPSTP